MIKFLRRFVHPLTTGCIYCLTTIAGYMMEHRIWWSHIALAIIFFSLAAWQKRYKLLAIIRVLRRDRWIIVTFRNEEASGVLDSNRVNVGQCLAISHRFHQLAEDTVDEQQALDEVNTILGNKS